MSSIQLSNSSTYDVSNMKFSQIQSNKLPEGVVVKRISISTIYPDGNEGDLIFETDSLKTYKGVNMKEYGKNKSYTLGLSLLDKVSPTENQKNLVKILQSIGERCKDHLLSIKKELKKNDLERAELKGLNPVFRFTDENGDEVPNSESIYPKIISFTDKKSGEMKFRTEFFDEKTGVLYDVHQLEGRPMNVRACIKVESIFIGAKIKLQLKILEAGITFTNSGVGRLLSRPKTIVAEETRPVAVQSSGVSHALIAESESDDASESEDEEVKVAPVAVAVKNVKTITRKAKK